MLDKCKYTRTSYTRDERDKRIAINSKHFKSLVPFGNGISEINAGYKSLRIDVPIYISCYILSSAKKILTSFMYDFLLYFIPYKKVAVSYCDTDSLYTLLAEPSLIQCVKQDLKEEFLDRIENCCSHKGKQRHPNAVLPRTCCKDCNIVDNKYPGLWKVSYQMYRHYDSQ